MKHKIRLAKASDAPAVARLHSTVFKEIGASRKAGEEIVSTNEYVVWIATASTGESVGYAAIRTSPMVYFSWLGVSKNARNSGVGAALIQKVHAYCKTSGQKVIMLDTRNRFKGAIGLYLKAGYDISGSWVGPDGELMIRMAARI